MRFMMIMKANKESEAGALPSREIIEEMGRFNEEMVKAGVLLAAEGLHPTSNGVRINLSRKNRKVTDGPFTETKELIAGFWLIQVKSREEAIAWAMRCPGPEDDDEAGEIELRQVFELADFPSDILTPETAAREEAMREEIQRKQGKPS
jgi:hypothetical protein